MQCNVKEKKKRISAVTNEISKEQHRTKTFSLKSPTSRRNNSRVYTGTEYPVNSGTCLPLRMNSPMATLVLWVEVHMAPTLLVFCRPLLTVLCSRVNVPVPVCRNCERGAAVAVGNMPFDGVVYS